jgi:hypothetical protein
MSHESAHLKVKVDEQPEKEPPSRVKAHEELVTQTRDGPDGPTGATVQLRDRETVEVNPDRVKPFKDPAAMQEALEARNDEGHRLVDVDPAYRMLVEARMAAAAGREEGKVFGGMTFHGETPETAKPVTNEALRLLGDQGAGLRIQTEADPTKPRFASEAEMVRAVNDPRYVQDDAYRAQVDEKITNM